MVRPPALAMLMLAVAGCSNPDAQVERWAARADSLSSPEQEELRVQAAIDAGTADPFADGGAAVQRGEFGLISFRGFMARRSEVSAVICREGFQPPTLFTFAYGDVVDDRVSKQSEYAEVYNRTVAGHPTYPHKEDCWPDSQARPGG